MLDVRNPFSHRQHNPNVAEILMVIDPMIGIQRALTLKRPNVCAERFRDVRKFVAESVC
ncbi:hypothetical protein SBA4_740011 [Candidatus Sulfopaludibacter sp. SbA4]|nr:hypothetical protein SBA4_740011 [Candidatus Sulfopaludibacter sp. SbA4]